MLQRLLTRMSGFDGVVRVTALSLPDLGDFGLSMVLYSPSRIAESDNLCVLNFALCYCRKESRLIQVVSKILGIIFGVVLTISC